MGDVLQTLVITFATGPQMLVRFCFYSVVGSLIAAGLLWALSTLVFGLWAKKVSPRVASRSTHVLIAIGVLLHHPTLTSQT